MDASTETAAYIGVVMALIEVIKTLSGRHQAKKADKPNPLCNCQFTGPHQEHLDVLFSMHDKRDGDNIPVWWVPKLMIEKTQGGVQSALASIDKLDAKVNRIDSIVNRIDRRIGGSADE